MQTLILQKNYKNKHKNMIFRLCGYCCTIYKGKIEFLIPNQKM